MKFGKKLKVISKIKLDSQPVCNEKHLKAKIKSYNGKIKINFHNSKIPKEDSPFIFLLVILIDSIFRTEKNYYPELFLECNCVVKEKKTPKNFIDEIEISYDSDKENSDEENPDKENVQEFEKKHVKDIKIFLKKKQNKRRKKIGERYQNDSEGEKNATIIMNVIRIILTRKKKRKLTM